MNSDVGSDERVFVAGPFKLPETVAHLCELPAATLSWTFNFSNCDYATQAKNRT